MLLPLKETSNRVASPFLFEPPRVRSVPDSDEEMETASPDVLEIGGVGDGRCRVGAGGASDQRFPPLADRSTDVAIVGAGLSGLTARGY